MTTGKTGGTGRTAAPQYFEAPVEVTDGRGQFFKVPRLTTVQRDALTNLRSGMIIWNSTTDREERYDGGNWIGVATASIDDGAVTVAKLDAALLGLLLPVGRIDATNVDYCKIG